MRARAYSLDGEETTMHNQPAIGGQLFTAEEMDAIREQYEETLAEERAKREDLEWQVRLALASVNEQLAKVNALLGERDRAPVVSSAPAPRANTAPRPTAKIGGPPPIPPKAINRGPLPPRDLSPYKRRVA
jgi:hypothetical protein